VHTISLTSTGVAVLESDSANRVYYYRARYYDQNAGRFLTEDPLRFGGGANFYVYVYNSPIGSTDPTGLSPADVQRIQARCHDCVDQLVASGQRLPSGGPPSGSLGDFIGLVLFGWANDGGFWFTKQLSCYGQARVAKNCLEEAIPRYDDSWTFN
jgi:RHS repeat-associated protein